MGGRVSSASKNKWNKKAYDRIGITVPKGQKEILQEYAASCGLSLNQLFVLAVKEKMERDKEGSG